MTTKEFIRAISLRLFSTRDVQRIEAAMTTDDAETMLTLVDALVGNARKPDPARAMPQERRRP